ncbi:MULTISPECIES: hypothetical protein [unclassified Streptomyces]|uniref:hypothetical protein n=1 Tax=unclassified Streptomyces TaxID=2593676 RepID=UPI0027420D29|nr:MULTISPECIES: hypothetical protein [unclassified Streptomyces]
MRSPTQARPVGLSIAAALLGLAAVSCDSGSSPKPEATASRATEAHGYEAAYDAGWRTGKQLFEDGGKGAAVREAVWGGCVRRSLTAQPRNVVEKDRGAWVMGCKQAVGTGTERRPPAGPVTRRQPDPDLLARFRSWAAENGAKQSAQQAAEAVLVHLGDRDYDVELTTAYTDKSAKTDLRRLADTFATWWDGDGGDNATAWNLILVAQDGKRLTTRNL